MAMAMEPEKGTARADRAELYDQVENAKFSMFHVKAILISSVGFFTDAYDLFVIGVVKPMIAIVYYPALNGKLPLSTDLWVTGSALAGTLIGQVVFGVLGDKLGRKKIYLITLMLMIFATIAQALSASTVYGVGALAVIAFWRFILGFGIGGDYPLSATITSEYSNSRWRGGFIAAVFAGQGIGIVTASIVSLIVVRGFKDKIENHSVLYLDYAWRIIIGLGCVPAIATIYLRSQLPETPRFTSEIERDVVKAQENMNVVMAKGKNFVDDGRVMSHEQDRVTHASLHRYLTYPSIFRNRNIWVLFGTCSTWFLLDISFYSQNLFLPNVLTDIGYSPKITLPYSKYAKNHTAAIATTNATAQIGKVFLYDTPTCTGSCSQAVYQKVYKTAAGNAIVAMMGTVPGYFFTVAFVDTIGRIPIQFGGFMMMTLILIILASAYTAIHDASKWAFIVLYAFTFFFANFGPNATTFITPVEVFDTKFRSTLHGVSAASGKAGAIVGAFAIGKLFLETKVSLQVTLAILASTNAVGTLCTIFVPETKRMTLKDAALRSQSIFERLVGGQVNPALEDEIAAGHMNGNATDGVKAI